MSTVTITQTITYDTDGGNNGNNGGDYSGYTRRKRPSNDESDIGGYHKKQKVDQADDMDIDLGEGITLHLHRHRDSNGGDRNQPSGNYGMPGRRYGDAEHPDRSLLSPRSNRGGLSQDTFIDACANNRISPNDAEDYFAVKTMQKFQKDNGIGLISRDQLEEMATKGTLNGKQIPGNEDQREDARCAAQIYMANNGRLFKKIEAATDGKHDSKLGADDPNEALKKGLIEAPPLSERQAVYVMQKFQKDNKIGLMSYDRMKEIADKGTMDGKPIPGNAMEQALVRSSAKTYMANNSALFDKIESATDGKHDSQLGADDPTAARKKGIFLSDRVPGNNNGINIRPNDPRQIDIDIPSGRGGNRHISIDLDLDEEYMPGDDKWDLPNGHHYPIDINRPRDNGKTPMSDAKAVETIESFQNKHGIDLISRDQMQEIAEKGTLDGKPIPGDAKEQAQVRSAATTYMANNAALFKKVESQYNGEHDSKLSATDAREARKHGVVEMTDDRAVATLEDFQKRLGINTLSYDQIKKLADEGKIDGFPFKLPEDFQLAAKKYMANNGALFDRIESAKTGEHDSLLGSEDPDAARKKGLIGDAA